MSQNIADPREQARFAAFLREAGAFLGRRRGQLRQSCTEAGAVCRDAKYGQFTRRLEDALAACEEFERLAVRYADSLSNKASRGDRYLEAGGGLGGGLRASAGVMDDFGVQLERCVAAQMDGPGEFLHAAEGRVEKLEGRIDTLRGTIEELDRELEAVPHDSEEEDEEENHRRRDRLESEIEREKSRLRDMESAVERLRNATEHFSRQHAALESFLGPGGANPRAFLRDAVERLRAYEAAPIDAGPGRLAAPSADGARPRAASAPSVPLPTGFVWVPISEIDLAAELAGVRGPQDDGRSSSYAAMSGALTRFRAQVMPELAAGTGADALTRRDQEARIFDTGGLRGAYDLLLGGDPIRLDASRSGFSIIDGRHRIRAALNAGWTHLPVRLSAAASTLLRSTNPSP